MTDIDKISLNDNIMKYCPACGSTDIAVFDELMKCHKCYRTLGAFELEEEFGE